MSDERVLNEEEVEYITETAEELSHKLMHIQLKCNRNFMILDEWNHLSNKIDDMEDFLLEIMPSTIEENKEFLILPTIMQLVVAEYMEFHQLMDRHLDDFFRDSLEKNYPEEFLEGLIEVIMTEVFSNNEWFTFDDLVFYDIMNAGFMN